MRSPFAPSKNFTSTSPPQTTPVDNVRTEPRFDPPSRVHAERHIMPTNGALPRSFPHFQSSPNQDVPWPLAVHRRGKPSGWLGYWSGVEGKECSRTDGIQPRRGKDRGSEQTRSQFSKRTPGPAQQRAPSVQLTLDQATGWSICLL